MISVMPCSLIVIVLAATEGSWVTGLTCRMRVILQLRRLESTAIFQEKVRNDLVREPDKKFNLCLDR